MSRGTSPRLDRVGEPSVGARRDAEGKEALFSTAPTAPPTSQVEVACRRCGVASGVGVLELPGLLRPPAFWNPVTGFLWGPCPSCGHRARLDVRTGQALRVLIAMLPGGVGAGGGSGDPLD